VGSIQKVYIWGQPATVSTGPYHAVQNPFKIMQNVSLNIVADNPAIAFLGGSATVYNPSPTSVTQRFEFTHDAATGLNSASCAPGTFGICGLQGYSVSPAGSFTGLGPGCLPSDPFCGVTASGIPAWLFGSVDFEVLQMGAEASLHLQIGNNGINHVGESSLFTEVVFGTDSAAIYRAGIDTDADGLVDDHDRNVTLSGDGPDMVVSAATLLGDYNGNGQVEQGDLDLVLLNWGDDASMPPAGWLSDLPGGLIDQADLDRVLLNWGNGSAQLSTGPVPEPSCRWLAVLSALALSIVRRFHA
jgi:hypothetical protein